MDRRQRPVTASQIASADLARRIDAVHLEDGLGDIQPERDHLTHDARPNLQELGSRGA